MPRPGDPDTLAFKHNDVSDEFPSSEFPMNITGSAGAQRPRHARSP